MKSYQILLSQIVLSAGGTCSACGPLGMQNTTEMTHQEKLPPLRPLETVEFKKHHCRLDLG